jgi:hypothetical protein
MTTGLTLFFREFKKTYPVVLITKVIPDPKRNSKTEATLFDKDPKTENK